MDHGAVVFLFEKRFNQIFQKQFSISKGLYDRNKHANGNIRKMGTSAVNLQVHRIKMNQFLKKNYLECEMPKENQRYRKVNQNWWLKIKRKVGVVIFVKDKTFQEMIGAYQTINEIIQKVFTGCKM